MKFHHWISTSGVLQNAVFFIRAAYRRKYLKRRIMYSYGHRGLFNPAVISNKEAHMIYGSMDKEAGSTQATDFVKKKRSKISDFFPKLNGALLKVTLGLIRCFI